MVQSHKGCGLLMFVGLALMAAAFPARGHEDHAFFDDRVAPYDGPGWRAAEGGGPSVNFPQFNVSLHSWITLLEFDPSVTSADDCWGYVSGSGREYALIGLSIGTGVVEVTNPDNAQIIDVIPGPESIWRDIKVYGQYAYAVSEGGSGIQVIDMSQVDSGIVTLVNTVLTGPGTSATHNVAINSDTGYLYRVGGGGAPYQGLRIYSLANPANPVYVAQWNVRYCHDAQVVNYDDGQGGSTEVAFCYANDTSGGGNPGVTILDVTNKSNITTIGSVNLSAPPIFSHPARFSHQGWLSPDRQYLYFGDEVDEGSSPFPTTTTRIIDVSDLSNPVQVGIFTNGLRARDHNLYTKDQYIFEANYRSGLRIFDATNPLAPVEVGHFDTWTTDDNANYNGLWNVFPYFPSGTLIGSDIEKGLFVWRFAVQPDPPPAPLPVTTYPHGAAKNRYVSFAPDGAMLGTPHAYAVLHPGSGEDFYISTPRATPPAVAGTGLSFLVSDAAPPLHDFAQYPVLHVGGCRIAPGETYEVRTTEDGVIFSAPLQVSTALVPFNGRWWADVVGGFSTSGDNTTVPQTPPGAWTPPDGNMNGLDVTAIVRAFAADPTAPTLTWVDLHDQQPDRLVNGGDVLQAVNAFAVGSSREFYPFGVPAAPGPQGQPACPAPPLESELDP